MTITTVSVERKYNLGNYQMLTLSLTADLSDNPEDETPRAAMLILLNEADRTARTYQAGPETDEPC